MRVFVHSVTLDCPKELEGVSLAQTKYRLGNYIKRGGEKISARIKIQDLSKDLRITEKAPVRGSYTNNGGKAERASCCYTVTSPIELR